MMKAIKSAAIPRISLQDGYTMSQSLETPGRSQAGDTGPDNQYVVLFAHGSSLEVNLLTIVL